MSFIWPPMLALLVLIPLGVWSYRALERRRRRRVAASGGLGLGQRTVGRPTRPRDRIPAVLLLLGLTILTVAMARPQSMVDLPREEGTVILAFDVSKSMAADDVKPTRLDAAKAAAKAFVERQPPGVVIGVVAFSGAGLSVRTPTSDQAAVEAAIARLTPETGTSLGQGILTALNTIALADAPPAAGYYSNRSPDPTPEPTPVPAGTHAPAVIVLVTDGENNQSPDPLAAAQTAADRGVRIYTVGLGSAAGTTLKVDGFQVHTQLDEAMLRQISDTSGGAYFQADDAAAFQSVYQDLDLRLTIEPQKIEITSLFAGASMLLLVIGGLCSLVVLGRLP
jgi:Ca-activated chloride channel family protein